MLRHPGQASREGESLSKSKHPAGTSMFSPPLAASTAPSTTTIESVLASLSSGSIGAQNTTLHVVAPNTGNEHKLSSPPLRRHPGAPLSRRVSDCLSSNEDDDSVNFPTTVKVATTARASEQQDNEKAEVTADAFPAGTDQGEGDFRFYSDGTFGVVEYETDNKMVCVGERRILFFLLKCI